MKTKITGIVLLLLITVAVLPLYSTGRLGNFKDKLKNSSDNATGSGPADNSSTKATPADNSSDSSDDDNGEVFSRIMGLIFIWNSRQSYLNYPYQLPGTRFNRPNDLRPHRKRWYITAGFYQRYYDKQLSTTGFDGVLTWRLLKLQLGIESYTENDFNFRDGMTAIKTMFGFDLIALPGFSLDFRLGWLRISEVDIDEDMWAFSFNSRTFITRPLVLDLNYLYAFKGNVDFRKAGARLGFIIPTGLSALDIGIGYNQIKLDSDPWERGGELSIRLWM